MGGPYCSRVDCPQPQLTLHMEVRCVKNAEVSCMNGAPVGPSHPPLLWSGSKSGCYKSSSHPWVAQNWATLEEVGDDAMMSAYHCQSNSGCHIGTCVMVSRVCAVLSPSKTNVLVLKGPPKIDLPARTSEVYPQPTVASNIVDSHLVFQPLLHLGI